MPNIIDLRKEEGSSIDHLLIYLEKLSSIRNRNIIVYYSGWLTNYYELPLGIDDNDINGFMAMNHGLDFNKGLDLILHTPGGDVAATESIINYFYNLYEGDIVAIVPQIAMSGGTMIACSCKEIMMGKQSSLGPIDPQFLGVPAQGIITEFEQAKKEIIENPVLLPLWQTIISQYSPTLLDSCQNAIEWSEEILKKSLARNMFKDYENEDSIKKIMEVLGSHKNTKAHDRHLSINKCKEIGLNITELETNNKIQDYVLSIHHACMDIFEENNTYKIFANQNGRLMTRNYD